MTEERDAGEIQFVMMEVFEPKLETAIQRATEAIRASGMSVVSISHAHGKKLSQVGWSVLVSGYMTLQKDTTDA